MTPIYICGTGAVSPAGWGVPAFRAALQAGAPLPFEPLARPAPATPVRVRQVPVPPARPAFFAHPRFRRVSPISQHAASAAMEALGATSGQMPDLGRLGLIMCLQCGCVQYSYRFFDEVVRDPSTASPLLFPETVFAAPVSHIAALLPNVTAATTIVGDPATFLHGLATAADWLAAGQVDGCVVIGAEEISWLLADALTLFERSAILAPGAGALYLRREAHGSYPVRLDRITNPHLFTAATTRKAAALAMRREMPEGSDSELLVCDRPGKPGTPGDPWRNWPGQRIHIKSIVGEGLMAGGAWACVAACAALANREATAAVTSLCSGNLQAIGARFLPASPIA